jgi:SAM-dependent methyltransferase
MPLQKLWYVLLSGLITAVSVACVDSQTGPRHAAERQLDVPYVSTPHEVVTAMLRLAHVTRDDVVYDLGCGDGRIVITAAQTYGARGTGVDLDPQRILEAEVNARQARVETRVRFLLQDLFATDLRDATVVTLYLLPQVNLQLRPMLLRDLKPGSRVVSHEFSMDDWRPDHSIRQHDRNIYLWIVPAQITGTWAWTPAGATEPYTLRLTQQYQQVSGTLQANGMEMALTDVVLVGDHLRFTALPQGQTPPVWLTFAGRLQNNTLVGHVEMPGTTAVQHSSVWWRADGPPPQAAHRR